MPDKKRGLKRPEAPVDLFTLQPEPELMPGAREPETQPVTELTKPKQRKPAAKKSTQPKAKPAVEEKKAIVKIPRIKTSVELLPETIELIEEIKSQHRRQHRRLLPMWKILDEAVRELAAQKLKE
jgi:hypothetical protein